MKRFRVLNIDFDTRATILDTTIEAHWTPEVRKQWEENQARLRRALALEFGPHELDRKIADFVAMGPAPFSILAWHNEFYRSIRTAFTAGAYYPALEASSTLGERILNHLVLTFRDSFRGTPEYKALHRKKSVDNWGKAIAALETWQVLQPKAAEALRSLEGQRNDAVHFRAELDQDARAPALSAIGTLGEVISEQFGAIGTRPWLLLDVPGEIYIKKQSESDLFVSTVYLPSCEVVGPRHTLEWADDGFNVLDDHTYEDREIDDAEFVRLRQSAT